MGTEEVEEQDVILQGSVGLLHWSSGLVGRLLLLLLHLRLNPLLGSKLQHHTHNAGTCF